MIGSGMTIVGGSLSLAGGVVTVMTGGLASPLIGAGLAFTVGGTAVNVNNAIAWAVIDNIKKTELNQAFEEDEEALKVVNEKFHEIKLSYQHLKNLFHSLVADIQLRIFKDVFIETFGVQGHNLLQTLSATNILNSGAAVSDAIGRKVVSYTGDVAIKNFDKLVDAVDGATTAATKLSTKGLGGVLIGLNSILVIVEGVDLGLTIQDMVKNKGHEAATEIRNVADKLERDMNYTWY